MHQVNRLVSHYFASEGGQLEMGGVPIRSIVEEHGTPVFVYDGHVLDRKWHLLRSALPPQFSIYYSVKANPNPTILKHFLARGCGLEIASGGEFYLAVTAGCPSKSILFAGPGKTEAELEFVLKQEIGEIHIESLREAQRIAGICQHLGTKAKIAVRVNPSSEAQGGAMIMGGRPAPFGIDEEDLDDVVRHLHSDDFIEFSGIHLYVGTQILDYKTLVRQYKKGLEIGKRVSGQLGRPLRTLDFGGGLGIPYFENERELDTVKLRDSLDLLMSEIEGEAIFNETKFIVEPGRYLVGEAGIYVTRIIDTKVSRNKKFLVVDGGMNHHLAASGNLGQVIRRNFPIALLNKLDKEPRETVEIVGPLCTPLDVLGREVDLPQTEVGDLVGIFQSGAYVRTASPLGFLSHPTPAEVLTHNGNVRLIRRRGSYYDLRRDIP